MKTTSFCLKLLPPVVYSIELVWFAVIVERCLNHKPLPGLLTGLLFYQLAGAFLVKCLLKVPVNFLEKIYWELTGTILLLAGSCFLARSFTSFEATFRFILLVVFPLVLAFHLVVILSDLLTLCCWFNRYKRSSK
jgi:hypothetical protein